MNLKRFGLRKGGEHEMTNGTVIRGVRMCLSGMTSRDLCFRMMEVEGFDCKERHECQQ
ncbi:hypothetical protein JN06_01998 [Bacteroides zoogleoformans]|nr:hypothetical protein JN06_01998 [Bacteroides zoogleoformans]